MMRNISNKNDDDDDDDDNDDGDNTSPIPRVRVRLGLLSPPNTPSLKRQITGFVDVEVEDKISNINLNS